MKTKAFIGTVLFALLIAGGNASLGSSISYSKPTHKINPVCITKLNARMVQFYFNFTDNNGHSVTLTGRGQTHSGKIDYFISETNGSGTVASGTASGTYSIDTNGDCTIDVTYTPSGLPQEYYTGSSNYTII